MDDDPRMNPLEALRQARADFEKEQAKAQDKDRMRGEYTAVVVRNWFESLTVDQLSVFTNLMAGLANEGKDNYMTSVVYGLAIGYSWNKSSEPTLPEGDRRFQLLDHGIEGMTEAMGTERMDLGGDVLHPPIGSDLEDPDGK